MPNDQFRWGLVSTARINRALIGPLQSSDRHLLLAVASRTQERSDAYAREWSIPRAYGSYEALLRDDEIEAVYIPLPNTLHREWTIRALEAGKHVLCEKPLAISVEDVDAIAAAADRTGMRVAEAFMYRHHPQTRKVKELIDSGAIGELQMMRGAFSYRLDRSHDIRLDPELGGGSIWDVGCYPISYSRYLTNQDPVEVFGWQEQGPSGVDLVFMGQLRFAGGQLAQFDCSFRSQLRMHFEVVGSEGSIEIANPYKPMFNDELILHRGDQSERIESPGMDLYLGEIDDLADSARHGKSPRISLEDSRGNVAAILALLRSAESGQPVSVR